MTNQDLYASELVLRFNQVFAYTPEQDVNIIKISPHITPESQHVCFYLTIVKCRNAKSCDLLVMPEATYRVKILDDHSALLLAREQAFVSAIQRLIIKCTESDNSGSDNILCVDKLTDEDLAAFDEQAQIIKDRPKYFR